MACNVVFCKMNDLCRMEDICCVERVLCDFRCAIRCELGSADIVLAIDRLIGVPCDGDIGTGSLSAIVRILRQHRRLLCSIDKFCCYDTEPFSRARGFNEFGNKHDGHDGKGGHGCNDCGKGGHIVGDKNKFFGRLCSAFDYDIECCPRCPPTLGELLEDIKIINDSRQLVTNFQKDMVNLLNAIFCFYAARAGCLRPCLPDCREMFRYIMYFVRLCVRDCGCDATKKCICKACRPEPALYPVAVLIFLALYFGDALHKYVEIFLCCCTGNNKGSHADALQRNISVSFHKNVINNFKVCDDQLTGTLRNVDIFDSCNNLLGCADLTLTGSTKINDEKHTFTANVAGVVGDKDLNVNGAIYGLVVGNYCINDNGCAVSTGILCGTLVELSPKEPCTTIRNPYNDAECGLCGMVQILEKLNVEKMFEIVGDNFGAYGRRFDRCYTYENKGYDK